MKLLQVDTCLGMGSTGRITESIAQLAKSRGWECFIIHGARFVKHPSCMKEIQSVSVVGEYLHYLESLLFDNHGLSSRCATRNVVEQIKRIQPDIVQLHCLHGYYLNYKILFEYFNTTTIPIVWTFHDCWAFTGHCTHFLTVGCERWKTECRDCPLKGAYPKSLIDCSYRNFNLKRQLFCSNPNVHIVSVSEWVGRLTKQSFLGDKDLRVIRNGVDLSVFKPMDNKRSKKFRVLGVSGVWTKSKGLNDFYLLREKLDQENYEIVIVGLSNEQMRSLPKGIKGIEHTESIEELVALYSSADVFFNPTYADSFPTVNIEALSCGTPVITYNTGGSPEAVSPDTGWVVEQGDTDYVVRIIKSLDKRSQSEKETLRIACRRRAEIEFDREKCFEEYFGLYEKLLR